MARAARSATVERPETPPAEAPPAAPDPTETILFKRLRETKNKVVFEEAGVPEWDKSAAKIGTLYVSKGVMQQLGDPDTIQVTIEAV
jgi:hypothetical protein